LRNFETQLADSASALFHSEIVFLSSRLPLRCGEMHFGRAETRFGYSRRSLRHAET